MAPRHQQQGFKRKYITFILSDNITEIKISRLSTSSDGMVQSLGEFNIYMQTFKNDKLQIDKMTPLGFNNTYLNNSLLK